MHFAVAVFWPCGSTHFLAASCNVVRITESRWAPVRLHLQEVVSGKTHQRRVSRSEDLVCVTVQCEVLPMPFYLFVFANLSPIRNFGWSVSCLKTKVVKYRTQNHNFTCCFVRVWNLVSDPKRTQIEGVWEKKVSKRKCTRKTENNRRKRLCGGEFHNLYCRVLKWSGMIWAGRVACMGEFIQNFGKKKRRLRRPRHWWKDNMKIDFREIGYNVWTGFRWFRSVQWRGFVNTRMNFRFA
jgi:hypothetical protein